ncbi:MFS transporter, FHS family, L-fucose permease, partial [Phenoliferia sp. Uapishka_3]
MGGGATPAPMTVIGNKVTKLQEYYAFGLITSLFFLWGFSYGLLDVLNKHFQGFFGITKLQSTGLQVAYFGAYIVYSPVAGMFISRFGYKWGIYMGLTLYAAGAMGFFGSARGETFGGFCASSFVIASGLATLEVCANSYVTVLGSAEHAAFRLNFSQSFNGLASFIGPLIASKYFFSDGNENSLGNVQYVYIAVAALGVAIAILFFFSTLPEITEQDMSEFQEDAAGADNRPFWKRWHCIGGFVVQFMYVGAQVGVASFVINYLTDKVRTPDPFSFGGPLADNSEKQGDYTSATASQFFGYLQIVFTVARFASTPLLRFTKPATLLAIYGSMCCLFSIVACATGGKAGIASLFIIFFFESIIYPTTFTLATQDMGASFKLYLFSSIADSGVLFPTGIFTKRAAGLLCIGVGGGAAFPPAMGAMADGTSTQLSYLIPAIGFAFVAVYGVLMMKYTSNKEKRLAVVNAYSDSGIEKKERSEELSEKADSRN